MNADLEEVKKMFGSGERIKLSEVQLADILSIALNIDVMDVYVETSHDYTDCYYEGDTPNISVDSIVVRMN